MRVARKKHQVFGSCEQDDERFFGQQFQIIICEEKRIAKFPFWDAIKERPSQVGLVGFYKEMMTKLVWL